MRDAAVSAVKDHAAALPNLDTIIRGLLYVYIFSLPFKQLLFVERNGFIILVVLLALWCAVNKRHFFTRTPLDIPLVAFVLWVGLTIPFAAFPAYSFKEFGKLLQQGLIFYVVVFFFRGGLCRSRLLWTLVGALFIVSAFGVEQFIEMLTGLRGLDQSGNPALLESVMSGEVWLTTYLVLLAPVSLLLAVFEQRPWPRAFYFTTSCLALICLLGTFSRAGLLALVCEIWAMAWFLSRRTALLAAAISSLLVVVAAGTVQYYDVRNIPGTSINLRVGTDTLVHRLDIWRFSATELAAHPLVGIGYGKDNFKLVYGGLPEKVKPGHTPVHSVGTHNTFLDTALGTGIPGLVLLVWLFTRLLSTVLSGFHGTESPAGKAIRLGVGIGVIGLVVRLLFDHMFIGTLAIQFWVLVALAMVVYTDRAAREQAADAAH